MWNFLVITVLLRMLVATCGYSRPATVRHYGTSFALSLLLNRADPKKEIQWRIDMVNVNEKRVLVMAIKYHRDGNVTALNLYGLQPLGSNKFQISGQDFGSSTDSGILPAILRLEASFPVAVFALNIGYQIEAMMAVPIPHFGTRYLLVTLAGNPVINVISSIRHTIFTFLRFHPAENNFSRTDYQFEREYQAFQIHLCTDGINSIAEHNFTGSEISATAPVGVICGNCYHGQQYFHLEEMLIPTKFWGKRHVVTAEDKLGTGYFLVRILTLDKNTKVHFHIFGTPGILPRVLEHSNVLDLKLPKATMYIQSDDPIQVTLYRSQPNRGDTPPLISMQQVIPMENWIHLYIIRMPGTSAVSYFVRVNIFMYKNYLPGIRLNHYTVDHFTEHSSYSLAHPKAVRIEWKLSNFIVICLTIQKEPANRILTVSHNNYVKFGVSVAARINGSSEIFFPAGAAFNYVGKKACSWYNDTDNGEDEIDNDCDGLIDEEIKNNKDDDDDGRIDEDLAAVHGGWNAWSHNTFCIKDCGKQQLRVHIRDCIKPSRSKNGRYCEGQRYKNNSMNVLCPYLPGRAVCPEDCAPGWWSYDCVHACSDGCANDCHKRTGKCSPCRKHFKQSKGGNCSIYTRSHMDYHDEHHDSYESNMFEYIFLGMITIGCIFLVGLSCFSIMDYFCGANADNQQKHSSGTDDPRSSATAVTEVTAYTPTVTSTEVTEATGISENTTKSEVGSSVDSTYGVLLQLTRLHKDESDDVIKRDKSTDMTLFDEKMFLEDGTS